MFVIYIYLRLLSRGQLFYVFQEVYVIQSHPNVINLRLSLRNIVSECIYDMMINVFKDKKYIIFWSSISVDILVLLFKLISIKEQTLNHKAF